MSPRILKRSSLPLVVALPLLIATAVATGQQPPPPRDTLPTGPLVFDGSTRGPSGSIITGPKFRVVPMRGLSFPYALVFLPDGSMLITERAGRLRIVRHGMLDPQPIFGMPAVLDKNLKGLNDVVLHPGYAENKWVYFTYYKPKGSSPETAAATLARARFDGGSALTDFREIFSTDTLVAGPSAARTDAQDPGSYYGKILRLNDDGSVPQDNPFMGRPGYKPEIYALGIRNSMGIVVHPVTGEIWESENGPQGGDEVNIIKAGQNYGWPIISFGRSYGGDRTGDTGPVSDLPSQAGMEQPVLFWAPSIALSGMAFYTGDRFPAWKGSLFLGGLVGTQLQRVVLNPRGLPIRRETLLNELKQRIREVRQGPDGLLYLLTDEAFGALLRLEPVQDDR